MTIQNASLGIGSSTQPSAAPCDYPSLPALEHHTKPGLYRKELDIVSPWTLWLHAEEGQHYDINPNSRWGQRVRSLLATQLLEQDARADLRWQLASLCYNCVGPRGWDNKFVSLTGGPFRRGTLGSDGILAFGNIGGLHLDYMADCALRNCCSHCKASCTITYHVFDSFHFDLNPRDSLRIRHIGRVHFLNSFFWHITYQGQIRSAFKCRQGAGETE